MKEEKLPKGMGGISFEEVIKHIESPHKYLIHAFSIDNVYSVEDEIKVINSYFSWWKNEYWPKKLNQLKEEEWVINVM